MTNFEGENIAYEYPKNHEGIIKNKFSVQLNEVYKETIGVW